LSNGIGELTGVTEGASYYTVPSNVLSGLVSVEGYDTPSDKRIRMREVAKLLRTRA
jgi:hypothetical protein